MLYNNNKTHFFLTGTLWNLTGNCSFPWLPQTQVVTHSINSGFAFVLFIVDSASNEVMLWYVLIRRKAQSKWSSPKLTHLKKNHWNSKVALYHLNCIFLHVPRLTCKGGKGKNLNKRNKVWATPKGELDSQGEDVTVKESLPNGLCNLWKAGSQRMCTVMLIHQCPWKKDATGWIGKCCIPSSLRHHFTFLCKRPRELCLNCFIQGHTLNLLLTHLTP